MQETIAMIFMIALGLWLTISPYTAWKIGESWKSKNAEPSEAFLVIIRLVGIVMIITGLAVKIM